MLLIKLKNQNSKIKIHPKVSRGFASRQRGVSIYLAVLICSIILTIALGISTIIFSQMKMTITIGHSVVAFYAADTGIERILYEIRGEIYDPASCSSPPCDIYLDVALDGATYSIKQVGSSQFQSVGTYKGVKRAIEITY